MKLRRAARARANVTDEGVPKELLNLESPHWATESAAREWLSKRGIPAPSGLLSEPWNPYLSLRQIITAWCVASGRTSPQFPLVPDKTFMAVSGLSRVYSDALRQGVRTITVAKPE